MSLFTKQVLALVLALAGSQALAHGREGSRDCRDGHHNGKVCSQSKSVSDSSPLNYHQVYSSITSTLVTVKDVYLRTSTGLVIRVPGQKRVVDLQDLQAQGKGILISTVGVTFPDNAPVNVVEIEVELVQENTSHYSINGADCELKVPKTLNLYSANAPFMNIISGQEYRIGAVFTALDDIQIDVIKTVSEKTCCSHGRNKWRSDQTEKTCEVVESQTRSDVSCKIANTRHLATKFIRPIDEF